MTQALASSADTNVYSPENLKEMSNAIRALSMDAVQQANSGHPGMPMGMADVATVLYSKFLKFDAQNPEWADRDRMILSGGHGSMLLYALNFLTGYEKMTIEQIKNFRQHGAITAGHPCSLAGHLNLNKMIMLYDDNSISIDGSTDLTFIDDTPKRFEAYGWNTATVDGHNFAEIEAAIATAQTSDKPTIICCKTKIGYGAPTKEGSASSHGAPLGEEEIKGARENLGWSHAPFEIPEDVLSNWREVGVQNRSEFDAWSARQQSCDLNECHVKAHAGDYSGAIAPVIAELKTEFAANKANLATRKTSGMCLEKLVDRLWLLIGGSADLTGSNNTKVSGSKVINKDNYGGNYINYGVREHAMAAAMNGITLHGGLLPYAGTFLQFADYSRPAIRLAALMEQRVIHVMTHDSIGLQKVRIS